jgi:hypothetical protein
VTVTPAKNYSLWPLWPLIRLLKGRHGKTRVQYFGRRILTWLAMLAVISYLAVTGGYYAIRASIPHNQVTYLDIFVWPVNKSSYNQHVGQTLILQAQADAQLFAEAMTQSQATDSPLNTEGLQALKRATHRFAAGIQRVEDDLEARQRYAELLVLQQRHDLAVDVLTAGLEADAEPPESYTALVLHLAQVRGNYPAMQSVLEHLLQMESVRSDPQRLSAAYKALIKAQLAQGNYLGMLDTAEEILKDDSINLNPYDAVLIAHIRLNNLHQAQQAYNAIPEAMRQTERIQLVKALLDIELGNTEEARHTVATTLASKRITPEHIEALAIAHKIGEQALVDTFMQERSSDLLLNEANFLEAVRVLAKMPASAHLQQLQAQGFHLYPEHQEMLKLHLVQAWTREGNWEAALQTLGPLQQSLEAGSNDHRRAEAYQLIAEQAHTPSPDGHQRLIDYLGQHSHPIEVYHDAALAMQATDQKDTALAVLNESLNHYPFNRQLIRLRRGLLGSS